VAGKKAPKLRTKVSGGLSSFVLLPANSLGQGKLDLPGGWKKRGLEENRVS